MKEHGAVMRLDRECIFEGEKAILVESVDKTWYNNTATWVGWLTVSEATWEIVSK